MKSSALLFILPLVAACANEPAAQTPTTTTSASPTDSSAPATTASAAPTTTASAAPTTTASATPASVAPALDLSTADKARQTIFDVLKRGDKEAFKSCVSKRILDAHKSDFDTWYGVWQASVGKVAPEKWKKITVKDEGGQFKLDEN